MQIRTILYYGLGHPLASVSQGLRTNAPRRPTAVLLPGGFPRIFCYGAHPNPLLFCCKTRPSPRMRVPGMLCVHKYRIWKVFPSSLRWKRFLLSVPKALHGQRTSIIIVCFSELILNDLSV